MSIRRVLIGLTVFVLIIVVMLLTGVISIYSSHGHFDVMFLREIGYKFTGDDVGFFRPMRLPFE